MSLVFDGFLFFNELRLLDLRMNILDPYVDHFVLTESNITFSGKPKRMIFRENVDLFSKFAHKIIYNPVYDTPETNVTWDREIWQRNAIKRPLNELCSDKDVVITGDVDEIPDLSGMKYWYEPDTLFHPMMEMYYYYLNSYRESNWHGSKVCSWSFMKDISIDKLRNMKDVGVKLPKSGWHWSFLGGSEIVKEKIGAFSHTEFDNPFFKENVSNNISSGKDLFFRSEEKMKTVPIDESFPEYIRNHQEELSDLIRKD